MKTYVLSLTTVLTTAMFGALTAHAHGSVVPHLHTLNGVLLGYDFLTLIALGMFAITGAGLLLAWRRK